MKFEGYVHTRGMLMVQMGTVGIKRGYLVLELS